MMLAGVRIARMVSSRLTSKLPGHFGIDSGEAAAIEALLFYALVLAFTLTALTIVHVPLTIFTLLGGAVAIGVGFGSQNLINNFLSGLILLFERPIRVGDLVQVDIYQGHVVRIGMRCTRLRTLDNTEVTLPNSQLLEKPVVNSTLGDTRVRATMNIGVGYGSDCRLVHQLLMQILSASNGILKSPAPQVHFVDFGDNALVFRLYYHIDLRADSSKLDTESEMRFSIEQILRENQIVIPFPQRTLSFDPGNSLRVQILEPVPESVPLTPT